MKFPLKSTLVAAFIGLAASATPAAATAYDFTISGGCGILGSGDLTTDGSGNVLSASGTLTGCGGSGILSLISGSGIFVSPSGYFTVDNVVYPSSDPLLDIYGLLFDLGGTEVNIWGNGPGNYTFYENNGFNWTDGVEFALSPEEVPEPITIALFGAGLLGLGALRRRKARMEA